MSNTVKVGDRARFTHPTSNGGVVRFTAPIVKIEAEGRAWVEMPERVRRMPFAPLGGKRYGLYNVNDLKVVR